MSLTVACSRERPALPNGYNVLLVTLDTTRADRLGAYGYRAAETPAIDRLAASGLRFDQAMSVAPLTLPSHATILSGLLPLHHGVHNNGVGSFPADRETLATLLSKQGYRTGAFVASFVLGHRFGLNRGFQTYDDEIPRDPVEGDHLEAERRGDLVVDRALSWLAKSDARPFFAWVHLYDPHSPYDPPEPYRSRHPNLYDGEIAFVDAQVKRLLDELNRQHLSEKTLIVVTADHGESLGEHGELTHGLLLYEPALRVPLIIKVPGNGDSVVETPVSLADLAPTIAGFLGVTPDTTMKLDGRDLSADLRDHRQPSQANLFAETEYPTLFGWSGLAAVRNGTMKYISAPHPELFDLSKDPSETRNVLDEERRIMRSLAAALTTLRSTSTEPRSVSAPDAETIARLASLGYVGAAPSTRKPEDRPDPKLMVPLFRKFEEATWAIGGKRLEEAEEILEGIVYADPQNPIFRGSLAKVARQRGNLKRAIELYREAVAASPDDAEAWYNLAVTFQEAGDERRSGEAVREALRRDPKHPEAHNALGIVLSAEGNLDGAMEEFKKARSIDPVNARAYNNIGNVYRAMRRIDEAEEAFKKSSQLAPTYPDPINGLGALLIDRDRPAEAIAFFDRALQLSPDYFEARLNRAVALQLSGDLAGAVREYRAFIAASSNAPAFTPQRNAAKEMVARLER